MTTDTKTIPPLSQSRQGDMACDLLYHARHVRGIRTESEPARRGQEIHRAIAKYMDYLGIQRVPTAYEKMAELSSDVGPESKEILERFSESYFFDSDKIYDTEIYISVDDNFQIIEAIGKSERRETHPEGVLVDGIIDLLVMESETEAEIYDWKSYWQIVDADTFQSKLYPLLVMLLNPTIQTVRFRLSFVRYGDAQRYVVWTRGDIPQLKDLVLRTRRRQLELHTKSEERMKATAGRHCVFCPLLLTECPMREVNPYSQLKPEERVGLALWMTAAKKENDRILKEWLAESGPIRYEDQNGTPYIAQFVEQERKSYPLDKATDVLSDWIESHPKDSVLVTKLTVSGLSSPLKAEKYAALAKSLIQIADVKKITKMSIGLADDEEEEQGA